MYRPTSSALASLAAALERGEAAAGRWRSRRGGPWREIALALALAWAMLGPSGADANWGLAIFLAASATLGVAHGALDVLLVSRPPRAGRRSAARLRRGARRLLAYIAASASVFAVLYFAPSAVMPLLLAFAVFHFASGVGEAPGARARRGEVEAFARPDPERTAVALANRLAFIAFVGAAPLAAPALLRSAELAATLALLPPALAQATAVAWQVATVAWCLGALGMLCWWVLRVRGAAGIASKPSSKGEAPRPTSAVLALEEVLVVVLLNLLCPPLIAFSLYFALVHSARHIEAVLRWSAGDAFAGPARASRRSWPSARTFTVAVLAVSSVAAVTLGATLWFGPGLTGAAHGAVTSIGLADWLHVALVATAAVSVPHAVLVARRAAALYVR